MELGTKEKKRIFIIAFVSAILFAIFCIEGYLIYSLKGELKDARNGLSQQANTVQQIINFLNK